MLRNLRKKVFEVLVGFDQVCFCGFCEAVKDSSGFEAVLRFYDNKAFATDCEETDGRLSIVIAHVHELGDHIVGFLSKRTFGSLCTDELDEFGKGPSGMNLIQELK